MSPLQDKYVNPLTDFGFKKLFGSEPNKDILMDFLNLLLPERHQIQELSFAKSEHLGISPLDRKAIFDIYCEGKDGEKFIVEVQKAKQNFFKDRSVYYASFPIREQAQKGEWNFQLAPVYTVGILDFIFSDHKEDEDIVHLVELKDQNCEVFYDKLKFIYVELPKFTKTESELETHLDKWLYVLRHLADLQSRPEALQERIFLKLFAAAELAQFNPQERIAYEDSLKYYRDMKNVLDTSKEEGIAEGIIKVAIELKKNNVPIDIIIKSTGLSEAEIEKL